MIITKNIEELEKSTGILYVNKLSLDEWLNLFKNPPEDMKFQDYAFPTDKHRKEYLSTIKTRADEDVKLLLEHFLIQSGSLGTDERLLKTLKRINQTNPKEFERLSKKQFVKRLILSSLGAKIEPWEGITWVIDLLPDFPNQAIDILNSYFLAHIEQIPDGRIDGLEDAITVIRAKYIGLPETQKEMVSLLNNLSPRDFEHLIERLYHKIGYDTELTPPQKDGGRDLIARKSIPTKKELVLVECKLYKNPIGVQTVRQLLGVVSSEKTNKGVLITSSEFTRGAMKFSKENPRIELIGGQELVALLNENFGAKWCIDIDRLILDSKRKHQRE